MNNSKIWLVVKPTVGIPLFLSAVAVGSFAVHVAVVTNTTWVADVLSGKDISGDSAALATDLKVLPASAEGELVILPDGRTARIVTEDAVTLAAVAK